MTVSAELARSTSCLRYVLKIDGLEHIFWQEGEKVDADGNPVGCDPPGGHPVADPSLVSLWPFDILATGQDADDIIGGYTAVASGAPAAAQGLVGRLYRTDTAHGAVSDMSSASYFQVSDVSALRVQRFTVCGFVYVGNTTQSDGAPLIHKLHGTALDDSVSLRFSGGDSTIEGIVTTTAPGGASVSSGAALSVGWHHVALTWDGSTLRLYIDGSLVDSDTGASGETIDYDAGDWEFGANDPLGPLAVDSATRLDDWAVYREAKSQKWIKRAARLDGWSRRGLACLKCPEGQIDSGIDLKEGVAQLSKMDFQLRNIHDPYDRTSARTRYFAKLFAPGRNAQSDTASTNLRRDSATALQLDADSTNIYVADGGVDGFPSAGVAYIGQETFAYTSTATQAATGYNAAQNTDKFEGCIKGIWPALRDTPRGRTYPYPIQIDAAVGGVSNFHTVESNPYSLIGREVGLYVNAWDPANAQWFNESAAELLWAGVITQEVTYEKGYWRIGADSILDSLNKKVGRHFPRGYVENVNHQGPRGLSFRLGLVQGSNRRACNVTLTAGVSSLDDVAAQITTELNTSANWDPSQAGVWSVQRNADGKFQIYSNKLSFASFGGWQVYLLMFEDGACHPLQALGFFGNQTGIFVEETSSGSGVGTVAVEAQSEPYEHYHPVDPAANGGELRMYWRENDQLWDDQGDYAASNAWVMCRDQPVRGMYLETPKRAAGSPGTYLAAYSSKSLVVDTTYDYQLSTANEAISQEVAGELEYDFSGFIGSKKADEPIELQQVYVPAYSPNASGFRGPIELLLFSLLSSGTTDYNDSTYDKLPWALAIDLPLEVVDWESFVYADALVRSIAPTLSRRPAYIIDEAVPWVDLWKREAPIFGLVLAWSRGKLTAKSIRSFTDAALAETTIAPDDRAGSDEYPPVSINPSHVVNQWAIIPGHPLVSEAQRPAVQFNDVGSQHGLGATQSVEIEHPGIAAVDPVEFGSLIGPRLWLFRWPHQSVRVAVKRHLYRLAEPGDWVTYQADDHPDPFGSGAMSVSAKAYVLNRGFVPNMALMYLDLLIMSRFDPDDAAPWAASAYVDKGATNAGWDNATKLLTLVAHTFGDSSTDDHDGEAFAAGHEVLILESSPEDPTSVTSWGPFRVVAYTSASRELELEASATLGGFDTTGETEYRVVAADYGDASVAQRLLGTWGASPTTQLLGGSARAQRWG